MRNPINALDRWLETAGRGLDYGATQHPSKRSTLEWDVSGRCEAPRYAEYVGRPKPGKGFQTRFKRVYEGVYHLELQTRCRRCRPCLKARAWYWSMRAESEIRAAKGRTWFVTLTLAPERHFWVISQARHRLAAQAIDFDAMSERDRFREQVNIINQEITLWLKRLRKQSNAPLRYVLVAERHKSGLPHFHALLHEMDESTPVRAALIKSQWRFGFSQCKLVAQGENPQKAARYVSKYLSKDALARVRASVGYGQVEQTYPTPPQGKSKMDVKPPLTPLSETRSQEKVES